MLREEETMATEKQNETQGDGGQRQQSMTVQRGQRGQQERGGGQLARRSTRTSPLSMMQRMFDDMDTSMWSPSAGTSPFSMMRRMFDDMERMLDTDMFSEADWRAREATWAPRVEITQHGDNLVVRADLPGISQDKINVGVENGALVIEGERAVSSEDQQADVWSSERAYGRFRRILVLPEGVDPEKVEARYQDGVLEVLIPSPSTQARGRRIEIQSGSQGERQDTASQRQDTGSQAQQTGSQAQQTGSQAQQTGSQAQQTGSQAQQTQQR
jgi:HSP20 family protein